VKHRGKKGSFSGAGAPKKHGGKLKLKGDAHSKGGFFKAGGGGKRGI
jgi:hypothetical protein